MSQGSSRGIPIDTDGTLSANNDVLVPSQKAVKTYADTKQPLDATLTALAGLTTGANQVPYSTGTDTFAQIDLSETLLDLNIKGLNLLGSTIKAQTLGHTNTMTFTTASMTSGRVYWQAVYIPQDCTITGVKWGQATQGNYTATAYNGVGLYSYSGGTLTQIAASTDDGTIWKATGSTMGTKAFSATVAVTRGIYYIAATYNQSAQTTAPALNALTTVHWLCNGDLTNSAKLTGTTSATSLPSPTQAISGVTAASTFFYFQLY